MTHYHGIFAARPQPQLQQKSFQPSEQELSFAMRSLQEKRRVSFGNQQILFCRRQEGLLSASEKVIQGARKKYMQFLKKNYNQKLSEELNNFGLLRKKIKEFENRQKDDPNKDDQDTVGKKAPSKKRAKEPTKVTAGKKKAKVEVTQPQPKSKKATKKQAEPMPQLRELASQVQNIPSEQESAEMNLINSMSQQQMEEDYE